MVLRHHPIVLEHLARQHLETRDVWSVALIAAGGGREEIERSNEWRKRERIVGEREREREKGNARVVEREKKALTIALFQARERAQRERRP